MFHDSKFAEPPALWTLIHLPKPSVIKPRPKKKKKKEFEHSQFLHYTFLYIITHLIFVITILLTLYFLYVY